MPRFALTPTPFAGHSRRVPADSAFAWLQQGWLLFYARPFRWLAISAIAIALEGGLYLLLHPPGGGLLALVLLPFLLSGMLHGVKRLSDEDQLGMSDLLAGFRHQARATAVFGLLLGAAALLINGVQHLLTGLMVDNDAAMMSRYLLARLISIVLFLLPCLIFCHAPALSAFNGMPPLAALQASGRASLRNWLPMSVFALLGLLLAFFAALPLLLGFFVLVPVLCATQYAAYRDLFIG